MLNPYIQVPGVTINVTHTPPALSQSSPRRLTPRLSNASM